MIEVKVFGSEPPCAKCRQAEEQAKRAAAKFPGQVTVEKCAAQSAEGLGLVLHMTPAIVVNGRVVSEGRVPEESELERVFLSELGG
ncbi:MAG: thioredoxin family protein [Actinomycetia bacterium]|nr:thioredoxin family protein [Actinomycetes bacterium]